MVCFTQKKIRTDTVTRKIIAVASHLQWLFVTPIPVLLAENGRIRTPLAEVFFLPLSDPVIYNKLRISDSVFLFFTLSSFIFHLSKFLTFFLLFCLASPLLP